MSDAFIINGLRTFIGLKNKAYKNIPTEDLAGEVLKELKLQKEHKLDKYINCKSEIGQIATGPRVLARRWDK